MASPVVVGIGGRKDADAAALLDLVAKALADHGRTLADLTEVTTIDRRAGSEGVRRLLEATGARLRAWPAEQLAAQPVAAPSDTVAHHVGTPSVAEAAVLAIGAAPVGNRYQAHGWVVAVGTQRPPDLMHHGDTEVEPGMLDFAVNVHATRPPEFLRRALTAAIDGLARYPDLREATHAVAAAHGVPDECVLLTSGAAEAFTLVAQQPWHAPVVVHPQFTEPEAALLAAGHQVGRLLLEESDAFQLNRLPGRQSDLVVVGNPTNPTSRLHRPEEIGALLTEAGTTDKGRGGRLMVVDEAFMDTVEDIGADPSSINDGSATYSLATRAANDQRLLVIRSLTKTYSIAGLRVGYVVGHPDVLTRLNRRRPPWPVSSLAAAAAIACVSDEGRAYAARVRTALPERLTHLRDGLVSSGFVVPPGPRGPFLLARHPEAVEIRNRLRTQGIAARRGDTFPGLGNEWLRFAARDRRATDVLLAALATEPPDA
jgi:histidinol-phosphate aminotransferase